MPSGHSAASVKGKTPGGAAPPPGKLLKAAAAALGLGVVVAGLSQPAARRTAPIPAALSLHGWTRP